jgi:Fumarylacetoacetate (FAA) hydrolase family
LTSSNTIRTYLPSTDSSWYLEANNTFLKSKYSHHSLVEILYVLENTVCDNSSYIAWLAVRCAHLPPDVEHAKEFNQSEYDASGMNDQPVFFIKRASSIVPNGHPIYLHPSVTSSVDYEGELGVIIGRGGIGIKKEEAWKHVW